MVSRAKDVSALAAAMVSLAVERCASRTVTALYSDCSDGFSCVDCQCVANPTSSPTLQPVAASIPEPNTPFSPARALRVSARPLISWSVTPLCGDGEVNGDEMCDHNAEQETNYGCNSGLSCIDCQCVGCGDGFIDSEGGEECDPMAINPGCEVNAFCNSKCECESLNTLPGASQCINYTMDFDTQFDGTPIVPGSYVEDSWYEELGITMTAKGGGNNRPRIFDTTNPGPDPDLGAPNKNCPGGGPGVGVGGVPGAAGENCDPLGNVLIIQELNADMSVPDDQAGGGTITMNFAEPIAYVYELGLMDIETYEPPTTCFVQHMMNGVEETVTTPIIGTGNNGKQTIEVNLQNVTQISIDFGTSGAITFVTFCY